MKTIDIQYRFAFPNGSEEIFDLTLDADTLRQETVPLKEMPEWARLHFCQCPNCPLYSLSTPYCPLAVDLIEVVGRFDRMLSYDHTRVTVITEEREFSLNTTVQRGLSSFLGLLMATSGCPMTDFFKPMARFHLPFSSMNETVWRAVSTYLMASYYMNQSGRFYMPTFEKLTKIYKNIQIVNHSFAERLRAACERDSMLNALVLLDIFAKCIPPGLEESLKELNRCFKPMLSSYNFDE